MGTREGQAQYRWLPRAWADSVTAGSSARTRRATAKCGWHPDAHSKGKRPPPELRRARARRVSAALRSRRSTAGRPGHVTHYLAHIFPVRQTGIASEVKQRAHQKRSLGKRESGCVFRGGCIRVDSNRCGEVSSSPSAVYPFEIGSQSPVSRCERDDSGASVCFCDGHVTEGRHSRDRGRDRVHIGAAGLLQNLRLVREGPVRQRGKKGPRRNLEDGIGIDGGDSGDRLLLRDRNKCCGGVNQIHGVHRKYRLPSELHQCPRPRRGSALSRVARRTPRVGGENRIVNVTKHRVHPRPIREAEVHGVLVQVLRDSVHGASGLRGNGGHGVDDGHLAFSKTVHTLLK